MCFVFLLCKQEANIMKKVWIEIKKSMEDHNLVIQVIQLFLIIMLLILCMAK